MKEKKVAGTIDWDGKGDGGSSVFALLEITVADFSRIPLKISWLVKLIQDGLYPFESRCRGVRWNNAISQVAKMLLQASKQQRP